MKNIWVLLLFIALNSDAQTTEVSEETKFRMFCSSLNKVSYSVNNDFVVIRVKNVKTKEVKEICTAPNFISGALNRETGGLYIGFDCKKYPKRYFEFSNDSALWNIGFNEYSAEELIAYSRKINVDSFVQEIKSGNMKAMTNANIFNDFKKRRYFAHLMFNRGVVTTSGCFGTTFSYFRK
jgi:hypothetical protein